jgi:hypothetical protein
MAADYTSGVGTNYDHDVRETTELYAAIPLHATMTESSARGLAVRN